jgi:transcriptional regulator with XRE-family HTH domain
VFDMSEIGERIKYLRSLHQMSQEELGLRVGVQRAAINKYETGVVVNIPIHTIEKLASVLDVSPTYLVGWDEPNSNGLSAEVKVLRGVHRFYGNEAVQLLEDYVSLNENGRELLSKWVDVLSKVYAD